MGYSKKPKKRPKKNGKLTAGKITRREKVLGILALTGLFITAVVFLLLYLYLQLN